MKKDNQNHAHEFIVQDEYGNKLCLHCGCYQKNKQARKTLQLYSQQQRNPVKYQVFLQLPKAIHQRKPLSEELQLIMSMKTYMNFNSPHTWMGWISSEPELTVSASWPVSLKMQEAFNQAIEAKKASKITEKNLVELVIVTIRECWKNTEGIATKMDMIEKMMNWFRVGLQLLLKDNEYLKNIYFK